MILSNLKAKTPTQSHSVAWAARRVALPGHIRCLKNVESKLPRLPRERDGGIVIPNLPLLDQAIFREVDKSEKTIERVLNCDAMYFYGEVRVQGFQYFRNFIERLVNHKKRKDTLAICIKTPGGEVEAVEKWSPSSDNSINKYFSLWPIWLCRLAPYFVCLAIKYLWIIHLL